MYWDCHKSGISFFFHVHDRVVGCIFVQCVLVEVDAEPGYDEVPLAGWLSVASSVSVG